MATCKQFMCIMCMICNYILEIIVVFHFLYIFIFYIAVNLAHKIIFI